MNSRENRSYNYKREDNKPDYDRFFKKKDQSNKAIKKPIASFNMEPQHFPVLINNTNSDTIKLSTVNVQSFAEMVALPKIVETDIEVVTPGKVLIQYDNERRSIKSIYGPKTQGFVEYENKEKEQNSLHYRMNKAIDLINKNQEKRIQYYDDVHGEGSYEEMFQKYMYEFNYDDDEDEYEEILSDVSETD